MIVVDHESRNHFYHNSSPYCLVGNVLSFSVRTETNYQKYFIILAKCFQTIVSRCVNSVRKVMQGVEREREREREREI